MKKRLLPVLCLWILIAGLQLSSVTLLAADEPVTQALDKWLVLGPAEVPAIAKTILGDNKTILDYPHLAVANLFPQQGDTVPWSVSRTLKWDVLTNPDFAGYETGVLYLATYLEPKRWLETTLNIHNTNLGVAVFLDGVSMRAAVEKEKITANLTLTNEKHLLLVKVLLVKGEKFTFKASLQNKEEFKNESIAVSLTPACKLKTEHILNAVQVLNIRVSPDGKKAALTLSQTLKSTGKPEVWLEILDTTDGKTIYSTKELGNLSEFQWLNNSTAFSFTKNNKEQTSLYTYDLTRNEEKLLLENIKDWNGYQWAPDNSFLVYSTYIEPESKDYKYVKEIENRAPNTGGKFEQTIYFTHGGVTHKIFDKTANYGTVVISPDSKTILLQRNEEDDKNRPYNKQTLALFTVATMTEEKLFEGYFFNDFDFSPDSQQLLIEGGASCFDGIGNVLPKGVIPNDYDVQAFIYDLKSKKVEPLTRDFNPSIDRAFWGPTADNIYFMATDKEEKGLFKYSVKKKTFTRLNTGIDIVSNIGFSEKSSLAVYWGCSATNPYKLYKINLAGGNGTLLKDFNDALFKNTDLGTVKIWNYKTPEGKMIYGHIFYPPDFDSNAKYPCIVYYYGGTTPVQRDFGGRYPKGWYAAQGYIVYVLQPSGAIGFGKEFSAVHVNDWGKTTANEIISAVKQLIKEHPYIDPQRLGAMGASYGGFMTQYLATQTDIFAAYISHAGISALSSYWGVGDYGYSYSAVATADSFPWNRKDIYVGNSPLFMADRINKPILLLHGDIDNNVPPGESYQMFAALKLLGKEVALITFKDQQHFISEYKLRLQWMRSIMAWWDKHLKKQPEHWKNMYE